MTTIRPFELYFVGALIATSNVDETMAMIAATVLIVGYVVRIIQEKQ